MTLSRRGFLGTAGGCGLALGLGLPAASHPTPIAPDLDPALARHVLNRCSFGPRPGDVARVASMGVDTWLASQLDPARIDDRACDKRTRRLETLSSPTGELFEYKPEVLWKELASGKLLRACYSERQLFEVMVDFWSDHFNIDHSKGDCAWLKTADDRDVIRAHALGNFPDLLRASALGPAMLWYLDGRMNQRRTPNEQPNENYARELLELHTLGIDGGYTQADVMEAARCLTGWTVRSDTWFGKGRVEFDPARHDGGPKTVLGESIPAGLGAGDVDRLLAIACAHPATARFLARKLCARFIGPEAPEEAVSAVAACYADTGGDIKAMLRVIFATPAFRRPGAPRFKRPFHYVASVMRATLADIRDTAPLLEYLGRMGHAPFQYPTPDGYPDSGEAWHGTLFWRWRLLELLDRGAVEGVSVDWDGIARNAGGRAAIARDWIGPAAENAGEVGRLALLLAGPDFQGY